MIRLFQELFFSGTSNGTFFFLCSRIAIPRMMITPPIMVLLVINSFKNIALKITTNIGSTELMSVAELGPTILNPS